MFARFQPARPGAQECGGTLELEVDTVIVGAGAGAGSAEGRLTVAVYEEAPHRWASQFRPGRFWACGSRRGPQRSVGRSSVGCGLGGRCRRLPRGLRAAARVVFAAGADAAVAGLHGVAAVQSGADLNPTLRGGLGMVPREAAAQ